MPTNQRPQRHQRTQKKFGGTPTEMRQRNGGKLRATPKMTQQEKFDRDNSLPILRRKGVYKHLSYLIRKGVIAPWT